MVTSRPLSTAGESVGELRRQARHLLRAARSGSLGTVGVGGLPTVTLVTPATAPDLSVLLLLSGLSEHRRNLAEDPRCGLMVMGAAVSENPQTAPRLSLSGRAFRVPETEEAEGRRRWLAAHPYAEAYAGFADFALWRFLPERAQFIGGFAAAHRLDLAAFLPPAEAVAAIAAVEEAVVAAFNEAQAEAMAPWRVTALDVDGCDLVAEDRAMRVPFAVTVATPDSLRTALEDVVDRAGWIA
jgi:putative heme iron utilization protein